MLARPRYGMLVLLGIFFIASFAGIDIFGWMVGRPVEFLERPAVMLLRRLSP